MKRIKFHVYSWFWYQEHKWRITCIFCRISSLNAKIALYTAAAAAAEDIYDFQFN